MLLERRIFPSMQIQKETGWGVATSCWQYRQNWRFNKPMWIVCWYQV